MKKSPLTIDEQKELDFLKSLSYDELAEYAKHHQLVESKENVIKDLDMTYEEFLSTYDAVDLISFLGSFGLKIK